jgi:hypothetical protein
LIKTLDKRDGKKKEMKEETVLATGTATALGTGRWHTVALAFRKNSIAAEIDGAVVKTVTDEDYSKGMAGVGTFGYIHAQFDNFKIEAIAPVPKPD